MPKRKKRSRSRRSFPQKKSRRRKSSGVGGMLSGPVGTAVTGVLYGATRGQISQKTREIVSGNFPQLAQYGDEVTLAGVGLLADKLGGKIHPMVKKAGKFIFEREVYNIGFQYGQGVNLLGGSTTTQSSGGATFT